MAVAVAAVGIEVVIVAVVVVMVVMVMMVVEVVVVEEVVEEEVVVVVVVVLTAEGILGKQSTQKVRGSSSVTQSNAPTASSVGLEIKKEGYRDPFAKTRPTAPKGTAKRRRGLTKT